MVDETGTGQAVRLHEVDGIATCVDTRLSRNGDQGNRGWFSRQERAGLHGQQPALELSRLVVTGQVLHVGPASLCVAWNRPGSVLSVWPDKGLPCSRWRCRTFRLSCHSRIRTSVLPPVLSPQFRFISTSADTVPGQCDRRPQSTRGSILQPYVPAVPADDCTCNGKAQARAASVGIA